MYLSYRLAEQWSENLSETEDEKFTHLYAFFWWFKQNVVVTEWWKSLNSRYAYILINGSFSHILYNLHPNDYLRFETFTVHMKNAAKLGYIVHTAYGLQKINQLHLNLQAVRLLPCIFNFYHHEKHFMIVSTLF